MSDKEQKKRRSTKRTRKLVTEKMAANDGYDVYVCLCC